MKLILAIIQDKDVNVLEKSFVQNKIRATKLSTSGGFLRSGNTTFIIGIEDKRVDEALKIIKKLSHTREQYLLPNMNMDVVGASIMSQPSKVTVGGATVFVLDVEQFKQF